MKIIFEYEYSVKWYENAAPKYSHHTPPRSIDIIIRYGIGI